MRESESSAYGILLSDLLEGILSTADNPESCTSRLGESIRTLIGVRTVLVYNYFTTSEGYGNRLLSTVPERRRAFASSPEMAIIVGEAHELTDISLIRPTAGKENLEGPELRIWKALEKTGAGTSIFVPLKNREQQTGILILLGILDEHNISSLVSTMKKLSGVLALVLRNAMLYADLEDEVKNRTRELLAEREHLLKALNRNQVLLKEVHHRVKNNLQIIDSLLYLQSDKSDDFRVKQALNDGRGRLASMALVHTELYQSADLSSIQLETYIPRLVSTLLASAGCSPRLKWNLAPCILPLESCIPFGLIINEIITNAVKYAIGKGKKDTLAISTSLAESSLHLRIRDNGPGLPPDLDPAASDTLGMAIVKTLSEQLEGSASWNSCEGLTFELSFHL
jgi:two-component sensor histidine kinase